MSSLCDSSIRISYDYVQVWRGLAQKLEDAQLMSQMVWELMVPPAVKIVYWVMLAENYMDLTSHGNSKLSPLLNANVGGKREAQRIVEFGWAHTGEWTSSEKSHQVTLACC
jgi:hypothetical protein